MDKVKKLLGKRIKEIRKSRKLTQPQLAELVSVDSKYISRLETGTSSPSLDTLQKIANALKVDISELFLCSHLNEEENLIDKICEKLKSTNNKNVKLIYNITNSIINTY